MLQTAPAPYCRDLLRDLLREHFCESTWTRSVSMSRHEERVLSMASLQGGKILNPANWVKNPKPAFTRSDARGVYGVGHNSFARSKAGEWLIVSGKLPRCLAKALGRAMRPAVAQNAVVCAFCRVCSRGCWAPKQRVQCSMQPWCHLESHSQKLSHLCCCCLLAAAPCRACLCDSCQHTQGLLATITYHKWCLL